MGIWPCAVDILNPRGKEVDLTGSISISGSVAYRFINYFQVELDKKGYETILDWGDYPFGYIKEGDE